jgi:hypothetical protein
MWINFTVGKSFYLWGQIESTLYCAAVKDFAGLQQKAKSDVSYFVARLEILIASDNPEGEAQQMNNILGISCHFLLSKGGSDH